jgi:fructose-specific phosphotransferase system component IIB
VIIADTFMMKNRSMKKDKNQMLELIKIEDQGNQGYRA